MTETDKGDTQQVPPLFVASMVGGGMLAATPADVLQGASLIFLNDRFGVGRHYPGGFHPGLDLVS
jgi:hypothetical protein